MHLNASTHQSCQHVLILLDGRIVWGFWGSVYFIHKLSTLLITCGGANVFCPLKNCRSCGKRRALSSELWTGSGTIC